MNSSASVPDSTNPSSVEPDATEDAPRASVLVRGVDHSFGEGESRRQILFANNLTLMSGELVIMTGPSGSGKTTLLTLLGALRTIQTGSIRLLGRELFGLSRPQLTEARRDVGFIFQAHNLFDSLTAHQNVRMALDLYSHSATKKKKLATEMLTRLGLADRLHYRPRQLSGGQRQRVAIARALVNRPQLVLADEPTAALDRESGSHVIELLKELTATDGSTVLVVTHDSRVIDNADRIVNMVDGSIVSESVVEETIDVCRFLAGCPVFQQNSEQSISEQLGERRERITLPNSPELLSEVARKMRRERFSSGTLIVEQGAAGDRFYIVRSGRLEVILDGKPIAQMGPQDFFGEAALIREQPRNATVRCLEDSDLYSLNKTDFLQAVASSGTFQHQIRNSVFSRTR
ncbi:MAG: ATP-binding cassette domain-containing protein [Planctomycetota bacterium]|nr:ATP-binding cassette domain-containing protein [Planctomycetota bacterium]